MRITDDKCGSLWFIRFMIGLKMRMGHIFKPNMALSHSLRLILIQKGEENITCDSKSVESAPWVAFFAYVVITYVLSLQENEGQMLELAGLRNHWKESRNGHFIVVLYGKITGKEEYREDILIIETLCSNLILSYPFMRKHEIRLYCGNIITNSEEHVTPTTDNVINNI